jgi:hypothetical protein
VEKFKRSFHSRDSLHAKYSSRTGQPVVADNEWGHLQIGEYTALHPVLRFHVSGFFWIMIREFKFLGKKV